MHLIFKHIKAMPKRGNIMDNTLSKETTKNKRVLIVGTLPYRKDAPTRAFESYFSGWERDAIAQVFSNEAAPVKGHCGTLFQITDRMLLKKWFGEKRDIGTQYYYDSLSAEGTNHKNEALNRKPKGIVDFLSKLGAKHTPSTHLARGVLWKRSFWANEKFCNWLDEFKPECVFLSFSDDFFILNIAQFVSRRFDIPIVTEIGDDYIFNDRKSLSPAYHLYRKMYKSKVHSLFEKNRYIAYISDKMEKQYNEYFRAFGKTVYLTSEIARRPFRQIDMKRPRIRYFGNVLLDRYQSIVDIANALKGINESYTIDVYGGNLSEDIRKAFDACENIVYHNPVPYSEVMRLTEESDILLLVEAFSKFNIQSTKYSLSTKVADSLKSGVNLFAYGSEECGLIDYMQRYDACVTCTSQSELKSMLEKLIEDVSLQRRFYSRSEQLTEEHHSIASSVKIVRGLIDSAICSHTS